MPVPVYGNEVMRLGVCLTADELFERPTGLRECVQLMSALDYHSVLHRLAFVRLGNDAVFDDGPLQSRSQAEQLVQLLSAIAAPLTVKRAIDVAESLHGKAYFHPFSDQALAAAIELAGRCAARTGGCRFDNVEEKDSIARIVFSLQGATFSPQFKRLVQNSDSWESIADAQISEVVRNHLAHNNAGSPGNAIARLFAIATADVIHDGFRARAKESVDAWFERRLGMNTRQYLRAAFMVGACAARFDGIANDLGQMAIIEGTVEAQLLEEDRPHFTRLLRLAKTDATVLGAARNVDGGLTRFLYESVQLRMRPFVDLKACVLATSTHQVIEKFMFGLPHLIDEAAREQNAEVDVAKIRIKVGYLFESYVAFLFQEWLGGRHDIEVLSGFRKDDHSVEWDVLVVRGETAYYFEAKAKVFVLGMRTTGAFEMLDVMLKQAIKETWLGAEELLKTVATEGAPAAIRNVKRVVPALVVFDRIPIRPPYLDRYERHLESDLGLPVFTGRQPTILPVQTFEIEGVEMWEEYFDFRNAPDELFAYLEGRATNPLARHDRKFPLQRPSEWRTANGPLRRMLNESQTFYKAMADTITFAPP